MLNKLPVEITLGFFENCDNISDIITLSKSYKGIYDIYTENKQYIWFLFIKTKGFLYNGNCFKFIQQSLLYKNIFNIEQLNNNLLIASEKGHLDVVKFLISIGGDINHQDQYGRNSLISASYHGHLNILKYLIKDCYAYIDFTNNLVNNVLNAACNKGYLHIVKLLVKEFNADITFTNQYGDNALTKASENGHLEIVRFFVNECGTTIDDHNYALMYASAYGRLDIVKFFIKKSGTDITYTDEFGENALSYACIGYHSIDVVKYLVNKCNGNTNFIHNGDNLLTMACLVGVIDIIIFLVKECNIDINYINNSGETALMIASENGHREVVKFLENL